MSGYFAALAAQVSTHAGPAGHSATAHSLEQHVEVETPAAAVGPVASESSPPTTQSSAALATAASPVTSRIESAPISDRLAPQREHAQDARAPIHESSLVSQTIERVASAPVAVDARDVFSPKTRPASPINGEPRSSPATHASASRAEPAAQLMPVTSAAVVEPPTHTVDPVRPLAPREALVARPYHSPTAIERAESVASLRPVDVPRAIAPVASPAPRTEIRIGTISLEVRVPPPAPAPAPPVQATPTPAPSVAGSAPASTRFSLHRHYVRWG